MSAAAMDISELAMAGTLPLHPEKFAVPVTEPAREEARISLSALSDVETEAAILSEVILNPERTWEVKKLRPEHFYFQFHRWAFEGIRAGGDVDAVSLARTLRSQGINDATIQIAEVLAAPAIPGPLLVHCDALIEFWRRRELRDLLGLLADQLGTGEVSADDAVERIAGWT